MKKLAEYFVESESMLNEKAASQQQQKFMGMVHAMQKGEKVKGASPELKKAARTMKKKDVEDFAKTKHKGLPKKVSETYEEFGDQYSSALLQGIRAVNEARLVTEAGDSLEQILKRFKHEIKVFIEDGELDSDLYDALFDYYLELGDMPYAVAKAKSQDPHEWISKRLYDHLDAKGLVEVANPLELPAYLRKSSKRFGDFPAPLAPSNLKPGSVRPEEIPAVHRKAKGKDFPLSIDQIRDTNNKLSQLETLRKMAGLSPKV
jgi:hypothetical protein